jgi:hypothetical protein
MVMHAFSALYYSSLEVLTVVSTDMEHVNQSKYFQTGIKCGKHMHKGDVYIPLNAKLPQTIYNFGYGFE